MSWDEQYGEMGQVWGEGPGELALYLAANRRRLGLPEGPVDILDIGCGYGRDAVYLAGSIPGRVLGIDPSAKAIAMARDLAGSEPGREVEFRCCDFGDLAGSDCDVVFTSNLYHILRPEERWRLCEVVRGVLRPGGLLLLSAHSVNDPEHYGKGEPVEGEAGSFVGSRYVHLFTREELEADFDFIEIDELFEHEYEEPRADRAHHHVAWILAGRRRA